MEEDALSPAEQQEIKELDSLLLHFSNIKIAFALLGFAAIFFGIIIATFPFWVKLCVLAALFVSCSFIVHKVELYVASNNRSEPLWN